MYIFDTDDYKHYHGWVISRLNGLMKYISSEYFKNKTILELGAGHGHLGNKFYELGGRVTSSDARLKHIESINILYPNLKTLHIDCDKDIITEKYDIILHWGLLYHLHEIEYHLKNISDCCNILLLETEVSDSDNDSFYIETDENGIDQAFNNKGIRPSPSYVERVLKNNGFEFKLIKDPLLNSDFHIYDWEIENTDKWRHGLRRFWICWKNIESPLVQA